MGTKQGSIWVVPVAIFFVVAALFGGGMLIASTLAQPNQNSMANDDVTTNFAEPAPELEHDPAALEQIAGHYIASETYVQSSFADDEPDFPWSDDDPEAYPQEDYDAYDSASGADAEEVSEFSLDAGPLTLDFNRDQSFMIAYAEWADEFGTFQIERTTVDQIPDWQRSQMYLIDQRADYDLFRLILIHEADDEFAEDGFWSELFISFASDDDVAIYNTTFMESIFATRIDNQ